MKSSTEKSIGFAIGIVSSLDDEENLGRVKVKFPHLGYQESDWARLAAPMAGPKRGFFFRPEVGDEVVVGFEHGDNTRPYILGGVWSQTDQPPPDDGKKTENNWRIIQSRSGHIVLLDDTKGKEQIVIVDKDNAHKVIISSHERKIQVVCDTGNVDVIAKSGTVTLDAGNIKINATGSIDITANGQVTIKGATVNIN